MNTTDIRLSAGNWPFPNEICRLPIIYHKHEGPAQGNTAVTPYGGRPGHLVDPGRGLVSRSIALEETGVVLAAIGDYATLGIPVIDRY